MPTESGTAPEPTADPSPRGVPASGPAAHAAAMIDAALVGTGLCRDAYWAAVRKGYNTPYNDPPRKTSPLKPVPVVVSTDPEPPAEPPAGPVAPVEVVIAADALPALAAAAGTA